jgi:hypothetical protein
MPKTRLAMRCASAAAVSTVEKIAVFAPMQSDSVAMTVRAIAGRRQNPRTVTPS